MRYSYPYPRMLVTVDALVLFKPDNGSCEILLIKRGNPPFEGLYALPGGFPEMDELLADAAHRELKEETGIAGIELKQLGTFDAVDRDPRGRNISVAFYGFVTERAIPNAGDDATEARWFCINSLPPLAFDHQTIIAKALETLGM